MRSLSEELDRELRRHPKPGTTLRHLPRSNASANEPWACPTCHTPWPHHGWSKLYNSQGQIVPGCEACYHTTIVVPIIEQSRSEALGLNAGAYAGMHLNTYIPYTALEEQALATCRTIVAKWERGIAVNVWLYSPIVKPAKMITLKSGGKAQITGCGTGKTMLMIGMLREVLRMNKAVRLAEEATLFEEIRNGYDANDRPKEDPLQVLHNGWLLAIDDVGTAHVKAESLPWYQEKLYHLINGCYTSGRPVVLTTNYGPEALAERLGPRIMSRLRENGVGLYLDGYDRRSV